MYRVCFAMTLFFLFMSLIMIGVKSSKDPRAGIQNGCVLLLSSSVATWCLEHVQSAMNDYGLMFYVVKWKVSMPK